MSEIRGWQAIADHLGVARDTARGYVKRGIPVRTQPGVTAIATTEALDAWSATQRRGARSARFGRRTHDAGGAQSVAMSEDFVDFVAFDEYVTDADVTIDEDGYHFEGW